jgi:sulfofructose kinase
MRVLAIGNATADIVLRTEGGLVPGEKVQSSSLAEYRGGQAANTAWTLAALGLDVDFAGAFGDDDAGASSLKSLRDAGISVFGSVIVPDCRTQLGIVVVDALTGERTIVMHRDPRLRLGKRLNESLVMRADLVYLDGHEPEASLAVARRAAASGVPVVSDAEAADSGALELLPLLSSLIAPLATIRAMAGTADDVAAVSALVKQGPERVVATDGRRGAIGLHRGRAPVRVAPARCVPRDTTGAGDAFHAGYVAATLRGRDFETALEFAAALAAATCEVAGPRISAGRIAPFRALLTRSG